MPVLECARLWAILTEALERVRVVTENFPNYGILHFLKKSGRKFIFCK